MRHPQPPAGTMRSRRREPGAQIDGQLRPFQETRGVVGRGDDRGDPGGAGDRRRLDLRAHPARAERAAPAGDIDCAELLRRLDVAHGTGPGRARPGGPQAVDVGEQHERIGGDQMGHERGQAIVVPEVELGGRHGVVLVDDGHRPHRQQGVEGGAHSPVVAAHGDVLSGEQHLSGHHAVGAHRGLPPGHEAPLPHGGRRLQQAQLAGALGHSQGDQSRGHRPGRHQDHVVATTSHPGDQARDDVDAVEVEAPVGASEGGRADLEHDTRPIVQARRPGTRRPHAPSSSDQPAASVQMPSAASSRSS